MDKPISTERWRKISAIFDAALTLPMDRRAQFLAEQAGDDASLLMSVQRLLDQAETRGDVFDRSAGDMLLAGLPSGLPPGSRLGAYRLVETIGRGGMGEVYRAERADGVFQKQVAAKVLRSEAVEHLARFEAERQVVARLDHPGIARLMDGGVSADGRPYMIMEYVAGQSLTDHVHAAAPGLDGMLALLLQVCEAVSFAHAHGVIHRDLKPANILVTAEGRTKLLDFGVAKFIDPLSVAPATATVAPLTVAYAAPEQLQGKSPTAATDVHAIGVILYELMTGHSPWRDDDATPVVVLMQRVLSDEAPSIRDRVLPSIAAGSVVGVLDVIVRRCLKKDPAARYTTVAELAHDLACVRRGEPIAARAGAAARTNPGEQAERRQLTVLACERDATSLPADEMDPEAFREQALAFQDAVAEVVIRYAGHVAQSIGDGMLIYFGYPQAREDDAERAVRCSHDILQALAQRKDRLSLQARIGVHTGPVVVGPMGAGRSETLAMGATTTVAGGLQALAPPHGVVISQSTLKLVPGLFITRDLGEHTLKGLDRPQHVFQLIRASGVRTRLEAADNLTPFVGRTQEVAFLHDRWELAREGQGQVVLVTAEPGLGKSRLLLNLREEVTESAHTWLECRCSQMERNTAFGPSIELLRRGLRIEDSDDVATRVQVLERAMDQIGSDPKESLPLLAPLFNLTLPAPYTESPYAPDLRRRKLLALLAKWTLELAREQPVLLAIEDLHWADPSSLDLIALLVEQVASHRVLLVLTARPEFQPAWPNRSHTAHLTLQPLRAKDTGQMLANLIGHRALPKDVADALLQRAGGVPLFLEEITKALLESGQLVERGDQLAITTMALDRFRIPETLQDSLTARIDRLGAAKALLQLCAVIGREVPYPLLPRVVEGDELHLQSDLETLTAAQLLYPRGSPPDATYLFKHALIQDAAYQSLLKSTQQKLHLTIGNAIEQHFKNRVKAEPAVLAEHFEKAFQVDKAVKYYQAAGQLATARAATAEAIAFFEKGLKLTSTLEEGVPRDRLESGLLGDLVIPLATTHGYAHPRVRALLQRGRELSPTANPAPKSILMGWLGPSHARAGEYERAAHFAGELVAFGKQFGLLVGESVGDMQIAFAYCSLGRFSEALAHCELSLRYVSVDLATAREIAKNVYCDPLVCTLAMKGRARWAVGFPDEAVSLAHQAIERGDAVGTPFDWCWAVTWGLHSVLRLRREPEALMQACTAATAVCERYGHTDGLWEISASAGVAHALMGRIDEGGDQILQTIALRKSMGTMQNLAWDWGEVASIRLAAGRISEARTALHEALAVMEKHDERFWESELHRIDGELRLAENNDAGAAQACFEKALEVSRHQQARSLELRAATSLARLWQQQGRATAARELLEPVLHAFTEGADTPDQKDARALLGA